MTCCWSPLCVNKIQAFKQLVYNYSLGIAWFNMNQIFKKKHYRGKSLITYDYYWLRNTVQLLHLSKRMHYGIFTKHKLWQPKQQNKSLIISFLSCVKLPTEFPVPGHTWHSHLSDAFLGRDNSLVILTAVLTVAGFTDHARVAVLLGFTGLWGLAVTARVMLASVYGYRSPALVVGIILGDGTRFYTAPLSLPRTLLFYNWF